MSLLNNNPLGSSKLSKSKDSKTSKEGGEKKVRNTYSMARETSFLLDEYKLKLRRALEHNVSKAEIVEAALIVAFREYERHGQKSDIAIELSKMIR